MEPFYYPKWIKMDNKKFQKVAKKSSKLFLNDIS